MWIFTPHGVYSAVEDPRYANQVQVRARVREDLVYLKEHVCPGAGRIVALPGRDYPYRVFMTKDDWARGLARMAYAIDYANFKDEVYRVQGKARESIFHKVWYELLALESLPVARRGRRNKRRRGQGQEAA